MMQGGNEQQVAQMGLGEDVWFKKFSWGCIMCTIRKDEVLILKVMGGTKRHWKRNTLHLAWAKQARQAVRARTWQAGGDLPSENKACPQVDCTTLGTWKHLRPSLSPSANWNSGSFSCPFRGMNLEKGNVCLTSYILLFYKWGLLLFLPCLSKIRCGCNGLVQGKRKAWCQNRVTGTCF